MRQVSVMNDRPPRTLGIMLAIWVSALSYSLMPLIYIIWVVIYRVRLNSIEVIVGMSSDTVGGLGIAVLSWWEIGAWGGLALGYGAVAVWVWRGGKSIMRHILTSGVVVALVGYMTLAWYRISQNNRLMLESGELSAPSGIGVILNSGFAFSLLVTLYVLWYLNRGPARAFFRGYYLPRSDDEA